MQAQELMRVHIVKARPEDSLRAAVDLMDLYQVTGLPVVDAAGQLIGMLTERDVMRALLPEEDANLAAQEGFEALLARLRQAPVLRVEDAMSRPAVSIDERADVREAAALMLAHKLKRLPVTSGDGQVIGILSRIEVCQALLEGDV